jgi:hypothetical protein
MLTLESSHPEPQLPQAVRAYLEGPGARGFQAVDAGAAYTPNPSSAYSEVPSRVANRLDRNAINRPMATHSSIVTGARTLAMRAMRQH